MTQISEIITYFFILFKKIRLNPLICGKNVFFYNDSFHLGASFFWVF
jgi:hypothetical protein